MVDKFKFRLRTDVRFGVGISNELGLIIKEKGLTKPIVILDKGIFGLPVTNELIENLRKTCEVLEVFENTIAEPDYDYLDQVKQKLDKFKPDCIIGIGGGSTMDLSKGIATLFTNPGKGITYRGFELVKNQPLPVIAVPTTAGTGSEVTPSAVFIEKSEKKKLGINTDMNLPILAILDPNLTLSCPRSVTVSSGMDAVVHAVESFVAKKATSYSRLFAKEGFRLVFNNLEKVVEDPKNVELRAKVLLGSHYAGCSLFNSGGGPTGALSYPLGTNFNVPHGIAGAVFLPKVVEINVNKGSTAYTELYDAIEGAKTEMGEKEKNEEFSTRMSEFCKRIGVPEKLTQFGVKKSDVELFVKESRWLKGALEQNPVPFDENDVKNMIERMV